MYACVCACVQVLQFADNSLMHNSSKIAASPAAYLIGTQPITATIDGSGHVARSSSNSNAASAATAATAAATTHNSKLNCARVYSTKRGWEVVPSLAVRMQFFAPSSTMAESVGSLGPAVSVGSARLLGHESHS